MTATGLSQGLDEFITTLRGNDSTETISVGELLDALDQRTYGPLLLLPAAVAASPLGGLPGMPFVTGAMIILFSGQMLVGRSHPWLPHFLKRIELPRQKLVKFSERAKPWIRKFGKLIAPRMCWLAESPANGILAVCCMGLALLFYPLALIPLAVFAPAAAVLFFSLGLVANDGLMIAIGFIATFGAVALAVALWPG